MLPIFVAADAVPAIRDEGDRLDGGEWLWRPVGVRSELGEISSAA